MLGKGLIRGSLRNKVLLVLILITMVPIGIFFALSLLNLNTQLHEDIQSRLEDNSTAYFAGRRHDDERPGC